MIPDTLSGTRAGRRALSGLMLLALAACSTHPEIHATIKPVDAQSLGVQEGRPQEHTAAPTDAAWWEDFHDDTLTRLIQQGLASNPNLLAAQTRLRRVQAMEAYTRGADKPQLQASAEVDRQRFTEHGLYPFPIAGSTLTTGTLQLEGSWEIDLFGRQRAELEAAIGQRRAAEADERAAALLLSTQIARSYVQLARLQGLREVAQRSLAQRDDMLKLIRERVQGGLDTTVELRQGEGALPDTRLQIETYDEQITLARHALAVLTGQAPNALDTLAVPLDRLALASAPEALPLDLLSRRPDVQAALWRAQAAGQEVTAARALFYPNVDLRSYAGYNAIGLDQLIKASSLQWGLMPAIHLPLFDADRRVANLQGKVADQDTSIASYNQTVLQAVQEVADQFSSRSAVARQQTQQQAAQGSAESAYALARERYQAGLGNYLTVLGAETAVLNQRRTAVDLQARALDVQIGLIRAVGGRLDPASSSSTSQTQQGGAKTAAIGDRS
jgi:NodT family efflux transporter outer membrane factor (OMF) lipoprotein